METSASQTLESTESPAENLPDGQAPEIKYSIAANEYGFYCIPRQYAKRRVPSILISGQVYEPDVIKFMRRHVGSGDVIAGGAFVGDFFPALCEKMAPKAQLHTFEPNPVSHFAASRTIELNGLKNVNLHPMAVGEEPATLPLLVSRPSTGNAMGPRAKLLTKPQEGSSIDVEVTTLDDLVPKSRKVSMLQLDIEGFEAPAIRGARRIIHDNAPLILLEAERGRVQRQYLRTLTNEFPDHDYRLAGVIERNVIFLPNR